MIYDVFGNLSVKECDLNDLASIMDLQDEVINNLPDKQILRCNSKQMFESCFVSPNLTLGVYDKNLLVAVGILYFPTTNEENLAKHLKDVKVDLNKSANYKLCMVKSQYRGNKIQYKLGQIFEQIAKNNGAEIICATVSPINSYSIVNFQDLGYLLGAVVQKYGYPRCIVYKLLNE